MESTSRGMLLAPPTVATLAGDPYMAAPGTPPVVVVPDRGLVPMLPWRLLGALALSLAFALMGWETKRLVTDQPWSDATMWWSIAAGAVAGACLLGWTWFAALNARRLIEPATSRELPDPKQAVGAWLAPFASIGVAVGIVASLGEEISRTADEPVSSLPLVVAVAALLLAIPLTFLPFSILSGMIRQVGGYSARLSQWMWVPIAMAVVGVGSIVALRFSGVFRDGSTSEPWAPLWVVGAVAVAPCVITVLLAWRAAGTVEEALQLAANRRQGDTGLARTGGMRLRLATRRARIRDAAMAQRKRVRLIPGANLFRLVIVMMLAGLALLTLVGSVVMFMFWLESRDDGLLPGEGRRAWDALEVLHSGARVLGLALIALASIWTFVAVTNARMASGRRRNPFIAALSWPAVAVGFWVLAERFVDDQTVGRIIVGLAAQAALLYVPFLLLVRAADAVDARRTPLRIAYLVGVVLTVYMQIVGGLTTVEESPDTDFGRLAVVLAIGALLQVLSTLAVTEACRTLEAATEHEAALHNALVDQREAVMRRHADAASISTPAASSLRVPM
ncbi:MAG TPA: hypothetical protein VES40_06805 [Ilumatobacteraceae bacterium]|nr:hypothetical protein [Ilumatobacteraceae bacterium]